MNVLKTHIKVLFIVGTTRNMHHLMMCGLAYCTIQSNLRICESATSISTSLGLLINIRIQSQPWQKKFYFTEIGYI